MTNHPHTTLASIPDKTRTSRKGIAKTYPLPDRFDFDFIFLLSVIASKWWINHNKKRIRIYLPESKRYLAQALKAEWGGTISNINRPKYLGVMWQTTSSRSLEKIREAAELVKAWLPPEFYKQLDAFMRIHL